MHNHSKLSFLNHSLEKENTNTKVENTLTTKDTTELEFGEETTFEKY